MTASLENTLADLVSAETIKWSKVNDERLEVVVSLPVGYDGGDPNNGYDSATRRVYDVVDKALAAHGLRFNDAGVEDDGSGEFWIYRSAVT